MNQPLSKLLISCHDVFRGQHIIEILSVLCKKKNPDQIAFLNIQ